MSSDDSIGRRREGQGRRASDLTTNQQSAVADGFVALSDITNNEIGESEYLGRLMSSCQVIMPSCEFTVMLRDDSDALRVVVASSEAVRLLDQGQIFGDERLFVSTARAQGTKIELHIPDVETREAAPDTLVKAIGFTSVCSIALKGHSQVLGVLNVFLREGMSLDSTPLKWISSLTATAGLGIDLRRSTAQLNELAGQLQHALTSRVIIEQAKGTIAAKLEVSVDEAFILLRRYCRSRGRKIDDVAADVIANDISAFDLLPNTT